MKTLLFAVVLIASLSLPVRGESVFAREGLGEWLEAYDLRGETLGSTGIGVVDPYNFTGCNPAAGAFSDNTLGYVGIGSGVRWASDPDRTARKPSTYLTGTAVRIPLPSHWGVRLSAGPATDASYALETAVATGWEENERDARREQGSRGLLRCDLGVDWRGGQRWAVGASAGVLFGSMLDEISYIFGDSAKSAGWMEGSDRRRLRFEPAAILSAGFLARPSERFSVGAFATTRASSEVKQSYRSFGGSDWSGRSMTVEWPSGFGAGIGIEPLTRLRLSADLIWRGWEDVEFDHDWLPRPGIGPFRNTLRWGLGLERLPVWRPETSILDRIAWRIGFAWIPWYLVDQDGDGIDEWRASAGVGLPIQRDRGSIDLLFAWGRRGSLEQNGLEEKYLRLGFACTFARVVRQY